MLHPMPEVAETLPWVTWLCLIQVLAAPGRVQGHGAAQAPCAQPMCCACGRRSFRPAGTP